MISARRNSSHSRPAAILPLPQADFSRNARAATVKIKGRIAGVGETLFLLRYFQNIRQIRPVIVLRGCPDKEGIRFVILAIIQPIGDEAALG
jgi:hypothetical protein